MPIGPLPIHQISVPASLVPPVTHLIASDAPSNASALPLKSLTISNPPNILLIPPNSAPKPLSNPPNMLLNIAPLNCSIIQSVTLFTLSKNDVSIDVMSGNKLSVIASETQGSFF